MSLNQLSPVQMIKNGDMSGNITSTPVHIQFMDNMGVQVVWTGTPTGAFGISVSNSATMSPTGVITGGTYTPVTLDPSATAVATGAAGDGGITLPSMPFAFMVITYTATSGSGTLQAFLTGKSI